MRLRRFILASLAALMALVSCTDEENLGLPTIKLGGDGTMTFETAGGDQQITVTATRDWWVECDADWLMVAPESGKASADAQTITVTAKANTGMDRTADVKFSIGMSFQTLTVTQAGPGGSVQPGDGTKENPYSAEKANEVASALGADDKITGVYVQGVVSEIKELSTEFGNATYWITDEGGKTTFYVYRGRYLDNAKFTSSDQLKAGDKVVVYGDLMNYMEDSPQLAQGNYLVSLNGTEGENSGGQEQDKSAVYHNNFDKETSSKTNDKWPYLDQFDGWKNETGTGASGVTYTFKSASARATSGNNNIWLPKTGGYLSVQGIALSGTTDLTLSFSAICGSPGQYKKTFNSDVLKVYLSSDNKKWVELKYDVTTTETEFESAVATFSVPANTASLSIAFEKVADETDGYRVDDVKLAASASAGTAVDFAAGVAKDFGNGGSDEGGSDEGNTGGEGGTEVVVAKSIETGDYWIMTADKSEVVIPIDDQGKGYGYWNVEAAADGASTAENAFTFTWVDGKGYTIQDSEGRHHYMTTYNSFSISTSEQSDGSHYWAVTANTDGTYSIVNTVSGKTVQMSSHGNFCPYTDVTGDLPTLVKADGSTGGDVTPPEGGDEGGEDPEPPVEEGGLMTVAEVLASTSALSDGSYIEAVVISDRTLNNLTSKKGLYVQDDTGALQFYLAANHELNFGDKVKIDLSGVTVGDYNGAVQVSGVALDKITTISTGNTVEPKTVTVADFLANKYEGQYIAIEGVQVAESDLARTFVEGDAHTSINVETADGKTFVIFSSKYASYGAETVPQGSGTIKGISSISKGTMQLIFAQKSDYAALTGERFGDNAGNEGGEVTPPEDGGDEGGNEDGNEGGEVTPPATSHTASIVFSEQGFANAESVDGKEIKVDDNITIICNQGAANNPPAYYDTGSAIRLYQNGAIMEVKAVSGMTIKTIEITFANNHYYIAPDSGSFSDEAAVRTWSGSASTVKFTTTGTDKNHRAYVAAMKVTYE